MIEAYDTGALCALMKRAYSLNWYSGRPNLFTIRMEGGFEAFSGRATELWECRFVVTTDEIKYRDGVTKEEKVYPAISVTGRTLKEACSNALLALKGERDMEDKIPF